jgi:hypothetical protein
MATNIAEFAYALKASARPNQFQVEFNIPTDVGGLEDEKRRMCYLCKSALIPQSTIGQVDLFYRGRAYHEAGETEFQPWTATFINSNDFAIRNAFEQWSAFISHRNDVGGTTDVSRYKADITVKHLDRNGEVRRKYVLIGAFPQDIGQIQLSYDTNNAVEEFDVTFVYDYFVVKNPTADEMESGAFTKEVVSDDTFNGVTINAQ